MKLPGIPTSLLEEAIEKYKIPAWPYEAAFDRVIVFSLPEDKATRETFVPDGKIVKANQRIDYEKNTTPRGVLVSAGLGAQDVLKSHGMGLGHVVWVARLSPWRHEVERDANGAVIEFLFLRAADVVGSENTLRAIREGKVKVTVDKGGMHHYELDGSVEPRFDPPSYVA